MTDRRFTPGDKAKKKQTCWLTSTVCQSVKDVALMTMTLETSGRVDTKVVTGTVKRAFVNICVDRKTCCYKLFKQFNKLHTKSLQ